MRKHKHQWLNCWLGKALIGKPDFVCIKCGILESEQK